MFCPLCPLTDRGGPGTDRRLTLSAHAASRSPVPSTGRGRACLPVLPRVWASVSAARWSCAPET